VNHLLEVAEILASHGAPKLAIIAGLLHDTVEDTEVTPAELIATFGEEVAAVVAEATDDKTLPKETRKALQVSQAAKKSDVAKQLKLADKISNLRAMMQSPPRNWDHGRRTEYIGWAARVAAGLKGVNPGLDAMFEETYREAVRKLADDV
jgi:(p)ppGpp synthase/HD superfamily hydrolase